MSSCLSTKSQSRKIKVRNFKTQLKPQERVFKMHMSKSLMDHSKKAISCKLFYDWEFIKEPFFGNDVDFKTRVELLLQFKNLQLARNTVMRGYEMVTARK